MDNVYLFIVPIKQMALTDTVFSCIPALMLDSKLLALPGGGGGGTLPPIGDGGAPSGLNKVTSIY